MKNLMIPVLLCCCLGSSLFAQIPNPVSNVNIRISEEQDKVTVSYDLARNPRIAFYSIKAKITLDGTVVSPKGLSGDIGSQVSAGLGKKIIWDVHQDVSELAGELKIEVYTDTKIDDNSGPCVPIKTLPTYAGLGGVAASGLGLLIGGLTLENDSKTFYDVYKTNLNPNDPVYAELSRDEHYDEANKKHKNGQMLMIAGGAALVTGGVIFVSRLIKINQYNKRCAGQMGAAPRFQLEPAMIGGASTPGMGFSLTYKF